MKRLTFALLVSASLILQGAGGGCKSPTAEFDHLREQSALAVAGTNTVEVLE